LKHALSRLPAPRNDYEIVVPDSESQLDSSAVDEDFIPDQADVEAHREAELRAKSEYICVVLISGTLSYDVLHSCIVKKQLKLGSRDFCRKFVQCFNLCMTKFEWDPLEWECQSRV